MYPGKYLTSSPGRRKKQTLVCSVGRCPTTTVAHFRMELTPQSEELGGEARSHAHEPGGTRPEHRRHLRGDRRNSELPGTRLKPHPCAACPPTQPGFLTSPRCRSETRPSAPAQTLRLRLFPGERACPWESVLGSASFPLCFLFPGPRPASHTWPPSQSQMTLLRSGLRKLLESCGSETETSLLLSVHRNKLMMF